MHGAWGKWIAGIAAGILVALTATTSVSAFAYARSVDQRLGALESTLKSTAAIEELRRMANELSEFRARYQELSERLNRDLTRFEQLGGGRFTRHDGEALEERVEIMIRNVETRVDRLEARP